MSLQLKEWLQLAINQDIEPIFVIQQPNVACVFGLAVRIAAGAKANRA
jgi:hypothetical protein